MKEENEVQRQTHTNVQLIRNERQLGMANTSSQMNAVQTTRIEMNEKQNGQ